MKKLGRLALSAAVVAALSAPTPAAACGGTFCDTGPNAMPVDQTGENILFVMDGQNVEAHVQIQYQGAAERFAWVIPVPALPEFEVGSEPLFQSLLAASVPAFGFTTQTDSCEIDRGGGQDFASGAGGSGGGANADAGTGPQVVKRAVVGAFSIVVLQGGTAQEVSDWLVANNYQTIPNAPSILESYVQKKYLFAAVKLNGGADVDEIHPLVFRYPGNQPCVPLKLTAVAATEDMGVRTFFLGQGRVVPTNYKHVTLNPVRIDWQSLGQNYNEVVSRAADSPVADGHAFATEYAGPSNVIATANVYSSSWNPDAFKTIAATDVVDELGQQGLGSCYYSPGYPQGSGCQWTHPLVQSLLEQYLPAPQGLDPAEFYSCLSCYADQIDTTAWNPDGFANDFAERISKPGQHAVALVSQNPYLTRMFTTISPAEMTVDPEFHARPDLPDVALPSMASQRILCTGRSVFTLPTGEEVALPSDGLWPKWDDSMPWAETIEEIPLQGDPIVLVDNTGKVKSALAAHNEKQGWPPELDEGGCACRTSAGHAGNWLAIGAGLSLLGLSLGRRRRRR